VPNITTSSAGTVTVKAYADARATSRSARRRRSERFVRRLIQAPLTWLGAILVITDVRAWVSGSELGWFTGITTTLIVACIALLVWTLQPDHHEVLVGVLCAAAALTSLYLVIARVVIGDVAGPRIAGALIALAVPIAPLWLVPTLAVGLIFSQSYLAIGAAVVGLAATRWLSWPFFLMPLPVVLCAVMLTRPVGPMVVPGWTCGHDSLGRRFCNIPGTDGVPARGPR